MKKIKSFEKRQIVLFPIRNEFEVLNKFTLSTGQQLWETSVLKPVVSKN